MHIGLGIDSIEADGSFRPIERLPRCCGLSLPAPHLEHLLTLPVDERAASDKILSALRTKAANLNAAERVRVVITLHDPNRQALSTGEDLDDIQQLENTAALEHQLVDKARLLGFDADRALANFPIVIGEIDAGELGKLAALPARRLRGIAGLSPVTAGAPRDSARPAASSTPCLVAGRSPAGSGNRSLPVANAASRVRQPPVAHGGRHDNRLPTVGSLT